MPKDIYDLVDQNFQQAFAYCLLKKDQRVPECLISVWKDHKIGYVMHQGSYAQGLFTTSDILIQIPMFIILFY